MKQIQHFTQNSLPQFTCDGCACEKKKKCCKKYKTKGQACKKCPKFD
jgi:hypothetical protein